MVFFVKGKLIAFPPDGGKAVMSSARKSRWSLKTSQFKDDSAKVVLLISLSSEVLSAINKGCRLGQQGYVLVRECASENLT